MNKISLFLFIVVLFLVVACSSSKEDMIKGKFKKYVSENFDNPKDLKEILCIKVKDTISYDGLKKGVIMLYELGETIDSLVEREHDRCDFIVKKLRSQMPFKGEYKKRVFYDWLNEQIELSDDMIKWNSLYFDEIPFLKKTIDSLLEASKGLLIYEYEIKTRIKNNNSLKIKNYYALEDSVDIRFLDKKPTFDDYSKHTSDFYEVAKRFESIIAMRQEIVTKKLELHNRISSIIE